MIECSVDALYFIFHFIYCILYINNFCLVLFMIFISLNLSFCAYTLFLTLLFVLSCSSLTFLKIFINLFFRQFIYLHFCVISSWKIIVYIWRCYVSLILMSLVLTCAHLIVWSPLPDFMDWFCWFKTFTYQWVWEIQLCTVRCFGSWEIQVA